MNKSKGFTLIELMTVISILSLMSAVILKSVNNARESARMSAVVQFEAGMLHAIGDQLVLQWKFDETSGNTVYDTSSFGNNGTITGTAEKVTGIRGNGLNLHNGVSRVSAPSSPSLNLSLNSFSASIWTKTNSAGDMKVFRVGPFAELNFYHGYLRNCFNNCENNYTTVVTDNKWHNVAVIGDSTSIRIYYDGKLMPAQTLPASSASMAGVVEVGWGTTYEGIVDEFRLYSVPLNVAQIDQLYAEGLKTHQNLAVR